MKRIDIKLGYSCNNNCKFCILADKRKYYRDRTTKEVMQEINKARSNNFDKLLLTGGEPTIRKDFFKLLSFANKKRFKIIHVESNGRMFKYKNFAEKTVRLGVTHFSISLHASNPKDYAFLSNTSERNFKEVIDGIKNLRNLTKNIDINCTINKVNYKKLSDIINLCKKLKINSINFPFVNPQGNAWKDRKVIVPRYSKAEPYLHKAIELAKRFNINVSAEMIPLCFMQGYEDCIAELQNMDMSVSAIDYIDNNFVETRKKGKIKGEQCQNCVRNNICEGFFESYKKIFGDSEFKPVIFTKDSPEELKIELTTECNLNCDFCFKKGTKKSTLAKDKVFNLIEESSRNNIKRIRFTGGEPLLRKDLKEILAYAKSKNLYILLNTNGLLINNKNLDLFNYVDDCLISFHDINKKEIYSKIFKKLKNKVPMLRTCTILTKQNINLLEEFYRFLKQQPIDDFFFLRPVSNKEYVCDINNKDIEKAVEKIIRYNKKYSADGYIGNSVPFCAYLPRKTDLVCDGGKYDSSHSALIIDSPGNYRTDYFSGKFLGKIGKNSLKSVWNSSYLRSIRKFEHLPSECLNCNYLDKCKGALSLQESNFNIKNKKLDKLAKPKKFPPSYRVLFIVPKYENLNWIIEPLTLEYIAAVLERNGCQVKIEDYNIKDFEEEELLDLIGKYKPDLVGISSMTMQVDSAYKIGRFLKSEFSNLKLAYGGVHQIFVYGEVHTTNMPYEAFEKGVADFVIIGEGEKPYANLIEKLKKGEEPEGTKSVCYRKKNGKIILNTEKDHVENLDDLPFPERDIVNIKRYDNEIHILPYAREVSADLITSRGCKGNCEYCSMPSFYSGNIRFRSAENVVDEIEDIVYIHNINNIHIHDDDFLVDKRRVKKICELIIQKGIKVNWICLATTHAAIKSKEIIPLMAKAGCKGIEMGLESADFNVLEEMHKNQDIKETINIDRLLRKNRIIPMYLMMSFYIGETVNSAFKTTKLMEKLVNEKNTLLIDYLKLVFYPYTFGQFATPYPGSRFYKFAKKRGIVFVKSWKDYDRQKINFIPFSFLDDIPLKKENLNKDEFSQRIDKYKKYICLYLEQKDRKGVDMLGFKDFLEYKEFLYEIYKRCEGSIKVQDFPREMDEKNSEEFKNNIKHVCLGIKYLGMFGLIKSK